MAVNSLVAGSDLIDAIEELRKLVDQLDMMGQVSHEPPVIRSCITCVCFDEKRELCTFSGYNMRPPARIIALGCGKHTTDDEIPF